MVNEDFKVFKTRLPMSSLESRLKSSWNPDRIKRRSQGVKGWFEKSENDNSPKFKAFLRI
ncbi:MAG: hypothetical protein RMI04_04175 [Thermofilaceae archaeon]|nr:hypothetical protein [Thermofilaceae archaeon]